MKKVQFVLLNNGEEIFNFESEYTFEDEYVTFLWEDVLYKIKLSKNVEFRRRTKEEEFVLKDDNTSEITLLDLNKTFFIKIDNFHYEKTEQKHIIKYTLESDPGNEKTIILTFID